jgi:hypothetical protein
MIIQNLLKIFKATYLFCVVEGIIEIMYTHGFFARLRHGIDLIATAFLRPGNLMHSQHFFYPSVILGPGTGDSNPIQEGVIGPAIEIGLSDKPTDFRVEVTIDEGMIAVGAVTCQVVPNLAPRIYHLKSHAFFMQRRYGLNGTLWAGVHG